MKYAVDIFWFRKKQNIFLMIYFIFSLKFIYCFEYSIIFLSI